MKKRIFAVLLSLCMAFSLLPATALAADGGEVGSGSANSTANAETTRSGDLEYSEDGQVVSGFTYTNGTMTITGDKVTVKNVTFGDGAKLVVNTAGSFTLSDCTFNSTTDVRTPVSLNVGSAIVTGNTFNGTQADGKPSYYNAVEFAVASGNKLSAATLSNNTFEAAISNNYFSTYYYTDSAVITAEHNVIKLANRESNAIRISNITNSNVTFNLNDNRYEFSDASGSSEYEGFILLQDFSKGDAVQDFSKVTINITNLTAPESAKQLLYVYADRQQSIITTNQPVVKGDSSIEKFFAAEVNGTYYKTLADAIAAANDGDTITMLKDAALDKLTEIHPNVTLDLGGKTVSRDGSVLDIYGDVTIKNGTIKTTGTETGAVWMNQTAKLTVEKDVTINPTENSSFAIGYYKDCTAAEVTFKGTITGGNGITMNGLIKDTGTKNKLTVDGAKITVSGQGIYQAGYSETALSVNNSTISGSTGIEVRAGKLNVTNSTISGSGEFKCVPNGNGGTTDGAGIAIAQHTTKLPIEVTISGGEISGTRAIYESNPQNNDKDSISKVKLSVTGGKFSGPVYSEDIKGFITGGHFTTAPNASYLAADKAVLAGIEPGYAFMVGDAPATEVKPATAKPSVDASAISKENQNAATAVASSIKDNGELAAAAVTATKSVSTTKEQAVEELRKAVANATADHTNIFVQTYLEVKPTAFDATKNTITLDIQPMSRVVAATVANATEIALEGESKNAVILPGSEKAIAIQTMTISIELPAAFDTIDTVYIQHKGYEYDAAVSNKNGTNIATFTNPHGFSEFTITAESNAAAKVNGTKYTTLQDAVNAVKDGETITVLKDNLSAEVSGNKTFTVSKSTGVANVALTAASGYTLTNNGDQYTVSSKSSSSGGTVSASYAITVDSAKNGTVSASAKSAAKGTTVTVTVKPDSGYVLDAVTVKDANGKTVSVTKKSDTQYTFAMPAAKVTVSAAFKAAEQPAYNGYIDVAKTAWYAGAVQYVTEKGLMNGTGENTFSPNMPMTRAMMMTILARYAGADTTGGATWYEKGMNWAVEKKISDGANPEGSITREQLITMLWRYQGSPMVEGMAIREFNDAASVSAWATDAMRWAIATGVIQGSNGNLNPAGNASRAEVATMLMRFCQL